MEVGGAVEEEVGGAVVVVDHHHRRHPVHAPPLDSEELHDDEHTISVL